MTGEAVAIGAGVSALGAGVSAYANNQALKKQDSAAAAGIMAQNRLRAQAQQDVSTTIQKVAQDNSANISRNQTTQQQEYAAALQRAAPTQSGAITAQPGASKRYAADVATAQAGVAKYGSDLSASTAAIDAPQLTQMQTQQTLGDTATKLGLLSDTSANQNALTQMQVRAIQANPWMLAAGSAIQGAGQGYIAGNAGAPKKAPAGWSVGGQTGDLNYAQQVAAGF